MLNSEIFWNQTAVKRIKSFYAKTFPWKQKNLGAQFYLLTVEVNFASHEFMTNSV